MSTYGDSQILALTAPNPRESVWRHRFAAAWAITPAFLRGRSGLLTLAAALVVASLLARWMWLGTTAVLPLLYVLPCAAMMAMCMKGHGSSCEKNASKPCSVPGGGGSLE